MVINQLCIVSIAVNPFKTYSELLIDSQAMLSQTVSFQFLEAISGDGSQFFQTVRGMKHIECLTNPIQDIAGDTFGWLSIEDHVGLLIAKADNHRINILARCTHSVKC